MLNGGCNCRAVRYEISSDPLVVAQCHCRNCQRQSGSAFSVNMVVPAKAFSITGELRDYVDTDTHSGNPVIRQFCPTCGSPIISRLEGDVRTLIIKAGTLDDPTAVAAPAVAVWTSTQWPWTKEPLQQMTFEQNSPQS